MILWCIRHAPVGLPSGTCYGISEVPSDAHLTRRAARHWAPQLPTNARLRVSSLGRAQQLADALLTFRPDLSPATVDARLSEMDFGAWELLDWDAIGRDAIDAWLADFAHHRVGGGESAQEVIDRVADALADERALGGHPVWITHAGVIRAATYLAGGGRRPIRSAADWPREAPQFGSAVRIQLGQVSGSR